VGGKGKNEEVYNAATDCSTVGNETEKRKLSMGSWEKTGKKKATGTKGEGGQGVEFRPPY